MVKTTGLRVTVFGAGAFGGWTALELVRRGATVTLCDAWGPGHVRASSGGETRIIRATYGTRAVYTRMAARALELWKNHDVRWKRDFYHRTGVLWLLGADQPFRRTSMAALRSEGVAVHELTVGDAQRRYPQIDFDGITAVFLEPDGGYLLARRACEYVVERFVAEGGQYQTASLASPVRSERNRVALQDGRHLEADAFVFACGPWLGALFPEAIGPLIASTRQEVYYFGTPAGDPSFLDEHLPAWIEVGSIRNTGEEGSAERVMYGIPGNAHRGFKVADDTAGAPFDPTTGDRTTTTSSAVADARRFIRRRFPDLADAPLVGAEVCQYESTPDSHFIIDRHPANSNMWIVGGGSGHGFKMGPAVGEIVAGLVVGRHDPDPAFRLARFNDPPAGGWDSKWS